MFGSLCFLLPGIFLAALMAAPAWADPPERAGRISAISGDVSFRESYSGNEELAVLNWPLTSNNVIATGRMARAEIRVGSTAIRLDEDTELEFLRLDDEALQVRLIEGRLAVRVKSPERAREFELDTPQGLVRLLEPGRYRFDLGDPQDTLAVAAYAGTARVDGKEVAATVRAGQRAEIYGEEGQRLEMGDARRDAFDDWALARDQRDDSARSLRFVSHELTGYEDLDDYGDWRETPEYGAAWYPRNVPAEWAPYRWGRWVWVEPWGWTWVDDAPWGFAPFHYGRWALVGNTWAWVPGRVVARPVYAPALVAWVGQPGWNMNFHLGTVSAVGWFPLAPREFYRPGYRCTTDHVRRLNDHPRGAPLPAEQPHREGGPPRYAFQHVARAVTVAPTAAVAAGRPLRREIAPLRDARSIIALPVASTAPNVSPLRRPPRPESGPDGRRPRDRAEPRGLLERVERRPGGQPDANVERPRGPQGGERSRTDAPPPSPAQPQAAPSRQFPPERLRGDEGPSRDRRPAELFDRGDRGDSARPLRQGDTRSADAPRAAPPDRPVPRPGLERSRDGQPPAAAPPPAQPPKATETPPPSRDNAPRERRPEMRERPEPREPRAWIEREGRERRGPDNAPAAPPATPDRIQRSAPPPPREISRPAPVMRAPEAAARERRAEPARAESPRAPNPRPPEAAPEKARDSRRGEGKAPERGDRGDARGKLTRDAGGGNPPGALVK